MTGFEHHPANQSLPKKRTLHGQVPGALAEAHLSLADDDVAIPLVDAIECAFIVSSSMEPRMLAEALSCPDAD